jgi:hypothetical protein
MDVLLNTVFYRILANDRISSKCPSYCICTLRKYPMDISYRLMQTVFLRTTCFRINELQTVLIVTKYIRRFYKLTPSYLMYLLNCTNFTAVFYRAILVFLLNLIKEMFKENTISRIR